MLRRIAAWALLTFLVGCVSHEVEPPTNEVPDHPAFADVVLTYSDEAGQPQACAQALSCPPPATCAAHACLGAPDNVTFDLAAGSLLEVGLLCGFIRDIGGETPTPDFRIWSSVPDDAQAVVSVSLDGSEFFAVDQLRGDNAELDLNRASLSAARFVRITHNQGPPIAIDAIEAMSQRSD